MSRFDKYDPVSGGFRCQLTAAISTNIGVAQGASVSITTGKVVLGAAALGLYRGLIVADKTFSANQPIDVMTDGEIVEVPTFTAGQQVYIDVATGLLTATAGTNQWIGQMMELGRLVVRFGRTT